MTASRFVAGVDGCRGGWIVALRPLDDAAATELRLLPTFAEVLELREAPATIAVDMPIGLPERITNGGRGADRAARAVLGARQSSVFAIPARSAVMAETYADACAAAFATSDPPRKISKQAWNIFPRIREIDRLMSSSLQVRVVECHPELAFWSLNDRQPLNQPKKVKSRPWPAGLEQRRALLAAVGYSNDVLCSTAFRVRQVGADDILDACALGWAATRIATGQARRFPDVPETDARGLRIEIWAG